jgi:hypothetical protein
MDGRSIVSFKPFAVHSGMLATVSMRSNTIVKEPQIEICSCSNSRGIWLIVMVRNKKKCDGEDILAGHAKIIISEIPNSKAFILLFRQRRPVRTSLMIKIESC